MATVLFCSLFYNQASSDSNQCERKIFVNVLLLEDLRLTY